MHFAHFSHNILHHLRGFAAQAPAGEGEDSEESGTLLKSSAAVLLLAPVLDAGAGSFRLTAAGARERIRRYKLDLWRVAGHRLDRFSHFTAQGGTARCIAKNGRIF